MIRSLLQAVVCITLCPLLAAQQVPAEAQPQAAQLAAPATTAATPAQPAPIALPNDTNVEPTVPDPEPAATAVHASSSPYAVGQEVADGGPATVHAGMPASGTTAKTKRFFHRRHSYNSNGGVWDGSGPGVAPMVILLFVALLAIFGSGTR